MHNFYVHEIKADVVVVGGGGAAVRAALSAGRAGAHVHLLAKAPLRVGGSTVHGASEIMGIGAAAGLGVEQDNPEVHYRDTISLARGFIDPHLVRILAEDAPRRIEDLLAMGMPFDRKDGRLSLIRSDFGSYARVLTAGGKTGKAIVTTLMGGFEDAGVQVQAPVAVLDLVRDQNGEICGVLAYHTESRRLLHYRTTSVVLASGGMHGAFGQQVSTREMTGDGQAISYRHGAELVNLEFHQFGPALVHPYVQLFSKSLYAIEPRITNQAGHEFLADYLPDGVSVSEVLQEKVFPFTTSNASRYLDIAIAREVAQGRGGPHDNVYFSYEHVPKERLAAVAPNTLRWMAANGLDMRRDKLSVGLAFQCMNGGVRMASVHAESSIPGLFVAGEVAGGVRGPDRPGGNSLAEGQVFGHRAGVAAAARAETTTLGQAATLEKTLRYLSSGLAAADGPEYDMEADALRLSMQRHCLVEKDGAGLGAVLAQAQALSEKLEQRPSFNWENLVVRLGLRNLAQMSAIVLTACRNRTETRGSHYRLDHPQEDPLQARSQVLSGTDSGEIISRPFSYTAD